MLSITDPPVTAHRGQRAKYPPTPDTWHGQINPQADIRLMLEMTEQTREAVDSYIGAASKKPGEFPFNGRRGQDRPITTRQSARLVCNGLPVLGWTRAFLARTHLRRTKATLIYRRTGNLRAAQLLLGHRKIESTVRYLGIEVDDALAIAEQVDV